MIKPEEMYFDTHDLQKRILQIDIIKYGHIIVLQKNESKFLGVIIQLQDAILNQIALQHTAQVVTAHIFEEYKLEPINILKARLEPYLHGVPLPVQWRFVSQIVINSKQEVDVNWITALFETLEYPIVLSKKSTADQVQYTLDFLPELLCYAGHFPNFPVYPGVAQIAFLVHFSQQQWQDLESCIGYQQLKFQEIIKPFDQVQLNITRHADQVDFLMLHKDGRKIASGRLLFSITA